jgi:hypothetical protein
MSKLILVVAVGFALVAGPVALSLTTGTVMVLTTNPQSAFADGGGWREP